MPKPEDQKARSRAKTLLVVSQNTAFGRDQLPRALQTPKVVLKAVKTTLADAKATMLVQKPDLILLEKRFSREPDFAEFLALIGEHAIHWMTIPEAANSEERPAASTSDNATTNSTPLLSGPPRQHANLLPKKAMVLLGTSTGGVDALSTILKDYPANCPPTLIVQHTGEVFGDGLIDVLKRTTTADVVKATHNLDLKPGMVCIAAGGKSHLRLSSKKFRVELTAGEKISGHLPSIDALFHSATHVANTIVAGVLTGMGKDGVSGLEALRDAGAATFSQDEASSIVYGMPKLAWTTGAAQQQVSLEDVTSHIMKKAYEIEMGGLA